MLIPPEGLRKWDHGKRQAKSLAKDLYQIHQEQQNRRMYLQNPVMLFNWTWAKDIVAKFDGVATPETGLLLVDPDDAIRLLLEAFRKYESVQDVVAWLARKEIYLCRRQ